MYFVLANGIADVDLAEFEKFARFNPGTIAMPCVDLSVGIKGMRTSVMDDVEDCQNSIFVVFENLPQDSHEKAMASTPFKPGLIYRRNDQDYVELKYEHPLGIISLIVYFLVPIEECDFGYEEDGIPYKDDLSALWSKGFIQRI